MFIQGLKDGVELQFKNPPYKKKLAKWEVRKVHEGLAAILEGWGDLPPNTRMHMDSEKVYGPTYTCIECGTDYSKYELARDCCQ